MDAMQEHETALFPTPAGRKTGLLRVGMVATGLLLVVAGIVLGILPIVPGFPLTIAGALMLAASSGIARRFMNWIERNLPLGMRRTIRGLLGRPMPTRVPR